MILNQLKLVNRAHRVQEFWTRTRENHLFGPKSGPGPELTAFWTRIRCISIGRSASRPEPAESKLLNKNRVTIQTSLLIIYYVINSLNNISEVKLTIFLFANI